MKTVYAYVVADLLHPGHIRHLERARALGDFLIVGVLSNEAAMEKKPCPILSTQMRMEIIKALRCVDSAKVQERYSPVEMVRRLSPDVVAESNDHAGNEYLKELHAVTASYGGRVVYLPYTDKISSTVIKRRVIDGHKKNKHD